MSNTNLAKTVRSVANNAFGANNGVIYNDKLMNGTRSLKILLDNGNQFNYSPVIAELQRLGHTVRIRNSFNYDRSSYSEVVRLHVSE